ncbi:MAG: MBOAT family protein [Oscillospiraceae bacterium]|nr:MBOAT family protein [Oscillospiraceae bacterium]
MDFTSLGFCLFLAVSLCVYHSMKTPKARLIALALANAAFFLLSGVYFAVYCGAVLIAAYAMGIAVGGMQKNRSTTGWLAAASLLLVLGVFKYLNFVLGWFGVPPVGIVAPLGISFYTLACAGYLVEVGKGEAAEKDPLRFFLFAGSFYTVTSGPIPRYEQLALYKELPAFDEARFNRGITRLMWGMAQKLVVANSLGVSVDYFFGRISDEAPVRLLCAAVFYSLQLYFDFAGYSDIVLGAAAMFGIALPENFVRPYLAADIQDFWRRWHISLSTWLQKYVYIPLGGSRKGTLRTYINLILVFLVSGLWHGAAWSFVFWGLLHGIASAAHRAVKPLWAKLGVAGLTEKSRIARVGASLGLFVFVTAAWVFFRAPSLSLGVDFFWRLRALGEVPTYLLHTLELPAGRMWPTYIGAALIFLRDILAENGHDPLEAVQKHPLLRSALCAALYAAVAFFSVTGTSSFLYHAF